MLWKDGDAARLSIKGSDNKTPIDALEGSAHAVEADAASIKGSEMNVLSTCQRSFAIAREDRILPPFACARQSEPPAAKADLSGGSLLPGTSRRECGGRESSHGTLSTV